MPETTKPLYVQYTGNKYRENCCDECRMLLDEGNIPIDRNGLRFNKINENGKGEFGQPARVRYILGNCQGLSNTCLGNCYYVREQDTGVEFIYKNIDGEMCDQDPPFSKNDLVVETLDEKLKFISFIIRLFEENIEKTIKEVKKLENKLSLSLEKYNFINDYGEKFSKQNNNLIEIKKNMDKIGFEIKALLDKAKELNIQRTSDLSKKLIYEEVVKEANYKHKLSQLQYEIKNEIKIFSKLIEFASGLDYGIGPTLIVTAPNIKSLISPIITGSINTSGLLISGKMQTFTIDTSNADPNSGTTPVNIKTIGNPDNVFNIEYITSATYDNVTGIIDFNWKNQENIKGDIKINAAICPSEYEVQLNNNPTVPRLNSIRSIKDDVQDNIQLIDINKSDIQRLKGEIEIRQQERNNILYELTLIKLALVPSGSPIDELTQRMIYAEYIRKTKLKYRLSTK